MIQLNLLPDVKLFYIKAQRQRRLVMTVSVLVTLGAVALLVLLLGVSGLQKKHLNDLTKDINQESSQLQAKPNINKILTVQNQLESLTALHDSKPAVSRLFEFLNQVTPTQVSISKFDVDFTLNTATIAGNSDSLSSVNKYIDTLKFTTFTTSSDGDTSKPQPAFRDVVLSSFGLSNTAKDSSQAASYTITLTYDKAIFDTKDNVTLTVPNITSTRAPLTQSSDLFKRTPTPAATPAPATGGNP